MSKPYNTLYAFYNKNEVILNNSREKELIKRGGSPGLN
jgi:hypothetical protein